MAEAHGPLRGVRVVEAATLAAGPMVATALGEFGAEVIKVEQPGTGDPMRTWGNRRYDIGLVWKSVDPVRRQARALEVDELVAKWVGERTLDEAMAVLQAAEVAAAPVYDAQQLLADEHLRARGSFVTVDDPDLGPMTVQAPVAVLTETPGHIRAVRVNGLETPWCHDDIIEVVAGARDALDVLIVPKARSGRDVWWVDVLLTQLETKLGLGRRRIALEVLVEESEGLANAVDIARASDRLEAVIFGAGDLSASQRARVDGNFDPVSDYPGDFWHFARLQVVTAARAAGIDAIDAPYPAYRDPDGYRRSAVHASLLGFDGKWAIHPDQVAIANEVFSPTPEEVEDAEQAVEAYRSAEANGIGAIGHDGRLVDAAHMRLAANVLHKATLAADERSAS